MQMPCVEVKRAWFGRFRPINCRLPFQSSLALGGYGVTAPRLSARGAVSSFQVEFATWTGIRADRDRNFSHFAARDFAASALRIVPQWLT